MCIPLYSRKPVTDQSTARRLWNLPSKLSFFHNNTLQLIFLEILDNKCIAIICFTVYDVITLKLTLAFWWSRFSTWPKKVRAFRSWQSAVSIFSLCNFIEIAFRHGCSPVNCCIFSEYLFLKTHLKGWFCISKGLCFHWSKWNRLFLEGESLTLIHFILFC